jgi:hypothetical protein
MKKFALVTAIAAVLSSGAHAQVAKADLDLGFPFSPPTATGFNYAVDCADSRFAPPRHPTFLSVATTLAASFLTGTICLDIGGPPYVLLQFGLTTSAATGRGGPGGTWFDSGTTDIYVDTGSGAWAYYATVDASLAGNQVDCLVNGGRGAQPGLVWPATGPFFATLPGQFSAPVFNPGPACYTNVLGMPAELYLYP